VFQPVLAVVGHHELWVTSAEAEELQQKTTATSVTKKVILSFMFSSFPRFWGSPRGGSMGPKFSLFTFSKQAGQKLIFPRKLL
jgi:hypothetical protein